MRDPEPAERAPTPTQDHVDEHPEPLRPAEEVIRVLKARGRKRKGGELMPERVRVATPDHVGIDKQGAIEGLELIEVVLEPDDRLVLRGQFFDHVEDRVEPIPLQYLLM
jgi:hypothetical protein